ncbi:hypothetical protein [Nocardia sp. NPDC004722]
MVRAVRGSVANLADPQWGSGGVFAWSTGDDDVIAAVLGDDRHMTSTQPSRSRHGWKRVLKAIAAVAITVVWGLAGLVLVTINAFSAGCDVRVTWASPKTADHATGVIVVGLIWVAPFVVAAVRRRTWLRLFLVGIAAVVTILAVSNSGCVGIA